MDGYQQLALAIVNQAIKDYKSAERTLERHPENVRAKTEMHEIERFFQSDWFEVLNSINPEMILKLLHER